MSSKPDFGRGDLLAPSRWKSSVIQGWAADKPIRNVTISNVRVCGRPAKDVKAMKPQVNEHVKELPRRPL